MDSYGKFASIYDELMEDVPYSEIADIIDEKIKKYKVKNNIIFDLACGTGILTGMLGKKGYDMIGADASFDMLQKAMEKNPEYLFLNQSMESFELYGTVGTIVSSLDSFNYLTEDGSLSRTLRLCNNYLEPDGLLIFDVNTEYKFRNVLADNIFTFDNEEIFYIWENNFSEEEKLCDFFLTFFMKENDCYTRFDEVHTERVYGEDEIEKALNQNGFTVLEKLDGFTGRPAHSKSERIMYVCQNTDSIQVKYSKGE